MASCAYLFVNMKTIQISPPAIATKANEPAMMYTAKKSGRQFNILLTHRKDSLLKDFTEIEKFYFVVPTSFSFDTHQVRKRRLTANYETYTRMRDEVDN